MIRKISLSVFCNCDHGDDVHGGLNTFARQYTMSKPGKQTPFILKN